MSYMLGAALAVGSVVTPLDAQGVEEGPLIKRIQDKVVNTIWYANNVPGLDSAVFEGLKPGILERWDTLVAKGVLDVTATDAETRPYFVALQAVVEYVLACELSRKEITSLNGVIHTPMPATPLCTTGDISGGLVDPKVEQDAQRAFTVQSRAQVIRHYLAQGGCLYIVYPQGGLEGRTLAQQAIYESELEHYGERLVNFPVDTSKVALDQTGAFYLFENAEGHTYAFAIKMTQANNLQPVSNFGLWFGECIEGTPVYDRISGVLSTIPGLPPLI